VLPAAAGPYFTQIPPISARSPKPPSFRRERLLAFLDGESRVLSYYGDLSSVAGLPKKLPKAINRVIALMKMKSGKVESVDDIAVHEMGAEPLEHLEKVLGEVYLPLLSNPSNQEGWGELASKEIVDRLHGLLANISIAVGATRGETCLPLPPLDSTSAAAVSAKDRIHLLEGAVITWTKQIKSVLKADPESLLKAGLHPTPDAELDFWKAKAANLNAIFEQLQSERVRRVLQFLEMSKSTYCAPFAKLCVEVFEARHEANDDVKFLRTLDPWFRTLNEDSDFEKLPETFRPIMHILLLVWKNSKYYNTPARLVVLIRQICNAIIASAGRFLTGKQVFEMIAEENSSTALAKLKALLKVCGDFKRVYFKYKGVAATECPASPWRIQNAALFMRLDGFLERVHDVLEVASVAVQFMKLEKVVIGGSKGRALNVTLEAVNADFKSAMSGLEGLPYDVLDVEHPEFADDLAGFRGKVKELERRLAAVLTQAFDDSTNLAARFKLLESFDTLLERPQIADELERKHVALVHEYGQDLKRVQEMYLTDRDHPPVSSNLPPIAGSISWCHGLRDRIVEPMARIKALGKDIMAREESKEVVKLYGTIVGSLDDFEGARVDEWGVDVETSSTEKLKLPLLVYEVPPGGAGDVGAASSGQLRLLAVNFDPALVRLLREVKYFLLLGLEVPPSALEVYKKAETFRRQTGSLDLIVTMYNQMMLEMLPVEAPLLKAQMTKIETTLARGVNDLNWKSPTIDTFLGEAQASVKGAYDMLFALKGVLREIVSEMEGWSREALIFRKSKPMTPDEFESMYKTARSMRYAAIAEGGKVIDKKLREASAMTKLPKGGVSPHWSAYVDFVNGIVVQGLSRLVVASLRKLVDLLSAEKIRKAQELPLLIVDLALPGGKLLRFIPDVVEGTATSSSSLSTMTIYDIVNSWVDSFYHAATMFKRLDDGDGKYVKEMVDNVEVQMLLATLNDSLQRSEGACSEFRAKFEAYSYLWEKDTAVEFKNFCEAAYGALPKSEEQIAAEEGVLPEDIPVQPRVPDLAKFDAEISRYRDVGEIVAAKKTPTDLGWLRINSQPIKYSLQNIVAAWINVFTSHLSRFVTEGITALSTFVSTTLAGLEEEVDGSDTNALRRCMFVIREVKNSRFLRKNMIMPLRKAVSLLKKHGVSPDDTRVASGMTLIEYLDQADLKVDAAINKTFQKKEAIYPFQAGEMDKIRVQAIAFDDRVRGFWNGFRKNAPFNFTGHVAEAYTQLDGFFKELVEVEAGAAALNEVEQLYELPVSRFNETNQCRGQLRLLKSLWDFRGLVNFTYDNWKTALWTEINTDALEESNKKMAGELKKLGDANSIAKAWGVFKDLEVALRDMALTLPLINELHSPSMRPRHWAGLATVCNVGKLVPSDPKFSLEDMLVLKLHTHVDEASEIVDTANKEQKIEKKMDEIEAAWRVFTLDFVQHKDSDVKVVKVGDECMEALDAHQMELQGIVGMGKVMEFFRVRVDIAQKNLGSVEEVLKEWLSVTKNWSSLESIFLASADIRAQLPDDTKRFEGIDQAFKELMKAAVDTPNAVEGCTKEGRAESLKEMTKNLELCQKSLNEYLDTKKKIFPRFYFVSNVALLDILSNGNNPPKIMPYTGDWRVRCRRPPSLSTTHAHPFTPPSQLRLHLDARVSADGGRERDQERGPQDGGQGRRGRGVLQALRHDGRRGALAQRADGDAAGYAALHPGGSHRDGRQLGGGAPAPAVAGGLPRADRARGHADLLDRGDAGGAGRARGRAGGRREEVPAGVQRPPQRAHRPRADGPVRRPALQDHCAHHDGRARARHGAEADRHQG
jgi:dynein heavy chain